MTLRVALDITAAVTQRAGVGRYTRELAYALSMLPDGPELVPFSVAKHRDYPLDGMPEPVALGRTNRVWRFEMLVRHLVRLPATGPWHGADVYHAPDIVFPPVRSLPVVTTVHDLSFVLFGHYHTPLNRTYLRLMTPRAVRAAQVVVADSASTKRDLVEQLRVPDRKVQVVYQGVASIFQHQPDPEHVVQVRRRYGLTEPFILTVGTLEPRKNVAGTIQAYALLRAHLPTTPTLAVIGGTGWRLDRDLLVKSADAVHIRLLGFVPDRELAALYAACSAFVYPSLYEGWGLPVAEALTLGAPTVTSNVSSLPEVAGDAALLVDPRQPEDIAAALERILTDTAVTDRLRRAGPLQSARFSSEGWARQMLRVYHEASAD
jgi:glycosyltransferase involved in cell wall biosynthesis